MKLLFVCDVKKRGSTLSLASWTESLAAGISENFEPVFFSRGTDSGVILLPAEGAGRRISVFSYSLPTLEKDFLQVMKTVSPDVIVLFGTERACTYRILTYCRDNGFSEKAVVFAQGICRACADSYAEGVPGNVIGRFTFRDFLRRQNIRTEQKQMFRRAEDEKKALELTRHFIGRTSLDQAILRLYNPCADYYKCGDVLRACFYSGEWRYASCIKRRIFISQYYYPLKGFHYLLEAVSLIRDKYPDIRIAAAGYNPVAVSLSKNELKDSSYIRYIKSLVRSYRLEENIELLGELSAEQMKEEYLKAHVFVLPSTIENSPNSLAEAMMLGVPCIASDVGGVTDLAEHKKEAYIYPSSAPYLLAYYLDRIFSDEEQARTLAQNGRIRALKEYDREKNIKTFEETMRQIALKS